MTEDGMGIAFRAQGIILPFSPLKKKKKKDRGGGENKVCLGFLLNGLNYQSRHFFTGILL
jgi:hypothetical protein